MSRQVFTVMFLVSQLFCLPSWAKDVDALAQNIDMQEPPFWMASYDEFKDLQAPQKDFYLKNLGPVLRQVPGLERISQSKLDEAPEWYKTWDSIRRELYIACQGKSAKASCEKVAEVRIKALNLLK